MVQPTIKKLTKGREKVKGLDPKKESKARAKASKRFPNTTETSKRIGNQGIHKKTGASLTSPNAREINARTSHLEKNKHGRMGQNMGRPESSVQARVNKSVSGKGINPNRPSSVRVTPTKVEGPGKSYLSGKGYSGRATVSNTHPASKKDPRVARTRRNMADMNRAMKKDLAKSSSKTSTPKASKTTQPVKSSNFKDIPGKKPLPKETKLVRGSSGNKTALKSSSTPKLDLSKTGTQRLRTTDSVRYGRMVARRVGADLSGLGTAAKSATGTGAKTAAKLVAKGLLRAVPYLGAALTSADAGSVTSKVLKKATTKKVSGTSMASVNPRGMHASQVKSAAEKLKRKK